jgi:hypothetical protein
MDWILETLGVSFVTMNFRSEPISSFYSLNSHSLSLVGVHAAHVDIQAPALGGGGGGAAVGRAFG